MMLKKHHYFIGLLLCVLLITSFIIYLTLYQRVIDEGFTLLDQHCIAINPLIIRRKQAYIDGIKTLQASGSAGMESYLAYQDQYLATAKEYVGLEKLWLNQQEAFMKRPDVAFLLEPTMQEAAKYQYDMYRSELEATEAVVKIFSEKDTQKLSQLMETIARTDREQRIAQQGYDLRYGQLKQAKKTFRDRFITIPTSQCPPESQQFPDVDKELGL
jgi:hypothetical protein